MTAPSAFRFLTQDDRRLLTEKAERRTYRTDEPILREGTHKQAVYILHSGRVRVEKDSGDETILVATLDPGEFFGVMSFLDDSPVSASVVADEEVTIDYLDGVAMFSLLSSVPGLSSRFYQSVAVMLSNRLREAMEKMLPPFLD